MEFLLKFMTRTFLYFSSESACLYSKPMIAFAKIKTESIARKYVIQPDKCECPESGDREREMERGKIGTQQSLLLIYINRLME